MDNHQACPYGYNACSFHKWSLIWKPCHKSPQGKSSPSWSWNTDLLVFWSFLELWGYYLTYSLMSWRSLDDQTPFKGTLYFMLGGMQLDSTSLTESRSASWIQVNKDIQKPPITGMSWLKVMYLKMKYSHFTIRPFPF